MTPTERPGATLLVRNATVLVTHDADRREIADGGFFARDGIITQVGPAKELPDTADDVLDLRDHVVLPGLVNTHHHLYQTLTRAVPAAQDADLFGWLTALYPIWARLAPEAVRVSTLVGLAELALSGCTTTSDHLYLYPNGCRLDDSIEAAGEIGLRFHATRGSMSLGESRAGCHRTAASRRRQTSCATRGAWSSSTTTRREGPCCASAWRPVRRSRSHRT